MSRESHDWLFYRSTARSEGEKTDIYRHVSRAKGFWLDGEMCTRSLTRWRRHLVNAYEVKAGMVFIAGKLCDPCLGRLKVVCIPCKALYKCSALPLPLRLLTRMTKKRKDTRDRGLDGTRHRGSDSEAQQAQDRIACIASTHCVHYVESHSVTVDGTWLT